MLQDKVALIFGGGGSIGAAVARQFASEGAHVFLSGRTAQTVERVAKQIADAGGRGQADIVDALDETAVSEYIDLVVAQTGRIDIEFNATGPRVAEYANGTSAVDLPADLFSVPVKTVLQSQYITARAAARHMLTQGSGVIVFLTGSPARPGPTSVAQPQSAPLSALSRTSRGPWPSSSVPPGSGWSASGLQRIRTPARSKRPASCSRRP